MSNVILLHLKLCILSQPMKLKPEKFISNNVAIGLGTSRHFEKKFNLLLHMYMLQQSL